LAVTCGRPRPLLLATSLIVLAWLGVKYVPVGVVLAAAWGWRFGHDRRAVTTAVLPLALAGAHYLWWHLHTFGGLTPYSTNVVWAGEGTATILDRHLALGGRTYRLHGLFVDARFGLVRWLPAVVLAVWGLRRRTALHGAVVGTAVLLGTFVWITMMGWWFPGRPLIVAFPAVAVLVALGAARLPRTAVLLSAWSLAIAATVVWQAKTGAVHLAVDPFDMDFPLPPRAMFPDFRTFTRGEVLASLAWGTALAVSVWCTRGKAEGEGPGRRGRAGLATGREPSPSAVHATPSP
jgi:hypothetical protein